MVQHHRVDIARHEKVGVDERVQLDQGRYGVGVPFGENDDVADVSALRLRRGDLLRRHGPAVGHRRELGARQGPSGRNR